MNPHAPEFVPAAHRVQVAGHIIHLTVKQDWRPAFEPVLDFLGQIVYEFDEVDDGIGFWDSQFFGCFHNDYTIAAIRRAIPGVPDLDVGDFPNSIACVLAYSEGQNDERPWHLLGRLLNGNFFYLVADCNYSGFDCRGKMALYAAPDVQTIIDLAMTPAARRILRS